MSEICDGVQYLHKMGVVHRDLKLENILSFNDDSDSPIKIIDFNLCKLLLPDEKMNDFFGTLVIS